jgi:hypothetical protein
MLFPDINPVFEPNREDINPVFEADDRRANTALKRSLISAAPLGVATLLVSMSPTQTL